MMRLHNVLSLITVLTLKSRDVDSVDPHGVLGVFLYCPCGNVERTTAYFHVMMMTMTVWLMMFMLMNVKKMCVIIITVIR